MQGVVDLTLDDQRRGRIGMDLSYQDTLFVAKKVTREIGPLQAIVQSIKMANSLNKNVEKGVLVDRDARVGLVLSKHLMANLLCFAFIRVITMNWEPWKQNIF